MARPGYGRVSWTVRFRGDRLPVANEVDEGQRGEIAHLKEREHDRAFRARCQHVEPGCHQLEVD
jgi:hypothetical protein